MKITKDIEIKHVKSKTGKQYVYFISKNVYNDQDLIPIDNESLDKIIDYLKSIKDE